MSKEIIGREKVGRKVWLRYNVAVATGEVIVGKIGHPSYLVEDVMGEVVNRAAMLVKETAKSESGIALYNETKKYE